MILWWLVICYVVRKFSFGCGVGLIVMVKVMGRVGCWILSGGGLFVGLIM